VARAPDVEGVAGPPAEIADALAALDLQSGGEVSEPEWTEGEDPKTVMQRLRAGEENR
jgi:hypothetical protein